uniref:Uncharacterized protein n=1 Tax=Anguilla anguilla TaxID=7936 RepID=A0A0E9VME6_ANGAN
MSTGVFFLVRYSLFLKVIKKNSESRFAGSDSICDVLI